MNAKNNLWKWTDRSWSFHTPILTNGKYFDEWVYTIINNMCLLDHACLEPHWISSITVSRRQLSEREFRGDFRQWASIINPRSFVYADNRCNLDLRGLGPHLCLRVPYIIPGERRSPHRVFRRSCDNDPFSSRPTSAIIGWLNSIEPFSHHRPQIFYTVSGSETSSITL